VRVHFFTIPLLRKTRRGGCYYDRRSPQNRIIRSEWVYRRWFV